MRKTLFTLIFILFPVVLFAQPVINPTTAEFVASVDHNVVENGASVVASYELRVFAADGVTLVRALNLNKPTPTAANLIIVTITTLMAALPIGDYVARVAAKGPGGETLSALSNPFQVAVRPPTAPTNLRITK